MGSLEKKIFFSLLPLRKNIFYLICHIYPYSSVHDKFCCRSANSLSFNWLIEIFAKKYGYFSQKIGGRKEFVKILFVSLRQN